MQPTQQRTITAGWSETEERRILELTGGGSRRKRTRSEAIRIVRQHKVKSNRCFSCGSKRGLSDHHLNPRSNGGTDHPDNLVTLCNFCHDRAEGPADGAWQRVVDLRNGIRSGRIPKDEAQLQEDREAEREAERLYECQLKERKENILRAMGVDTGEAQTPGQRLVYLKAKRRLQGYLDGDEAREHHTLLWGEESARAYWDYPIEAFVKWIVAKSAEPAELPKEILPLAA